MGQPNFWDNPEKAQQIIEQLKPLNGLLKPYEDLEPARGDLQALAELAEEDASSKPSWKRELAPVREDASTSSSCGRCSSGPQDASNAYLHIQAGTGGTEACDWAADAHAHVRPLGRAARLRGRDGR